MGRSAVLVIKILADAKQAAGEMDKASGKSGSFSKRTKAAAAVAGAALIGFGVAAFNSASQAQQAWGAVDAVFGTSAKAIHDFGKTSSQTVGLAASDYENMATVFGAQLKNMGVATDQLAPKTNDLIKLGADLAAQFGGSTSQATEALSALLRGERDPIERYGVSIKDANIKAYEAAHGLAGLTGAAKTNADMQATLALVTQQTADAHGTFAREADTAAGQQQRSAAAAKDASAAIGKALLPAVAAVSKQFAGMAQWASKNATVITVLIGVVMGLVVAVYAINTAVKVYKATMILVDAVQKATWLSNPIFLVVAAIVALVAVVIIAYRRFAWFRAAVAAVWAAIQAAARAAASVFVAVWNVAFAVVRAYINVYRAAFMAAFNAIRAAATVAASVLRVVFGAAFAAIRAYVTVNKAIAVGAFNAIRAAAASVAGLISGAFNAAISTLKRVFGGLGAILSAPFHALQSAISPVVGLIQTIIDLISKIHIPHLPHIPGLGSLTAATAAPARYAATAVPADASAAPMTTAGRVGGSWAASAGVVINVNGALDPDAVARQIDAILTRRRRRVGGVGPRVAGALA